jgi:YfiH family protein
MSAGPNPAREALYRALGIRPENVRALRQVHSRDVLIADRRGPPADSPGDGLVCRERGLWLSVTVADCLPVYLYHGGSGAFGLLHSGWKGTGIVRRALDLMAERWDASPGETAAVLGPCIRSCCYRVDRGRARAFEAEFGGPGGPYPLGPVVREAAGPEGVEYYLDLQAANARLLALAGVGHLAVCRDCTFTDERLGSFRREGPSFTRMIALLGPRLFT